MAWPTPQDYNEAIQNPGANFLDADLRSARPELTTLGLPRPITGNFASVYRLSRSGSDVAVRCFFREFADMPERYAAISAHLNAIKLPYTVGFTYLDQGIRVRAARYPVLKMDWVQGKLLDEYVHANLTDGNALRKLAESWQAMADGLRKASIAHGDLQHGNVLVMNGALKLVDYDGMYVPSLSGKSSLELGHANYQHPARTARLFGPSIDHFSLWVIYVSVRSLAIDPDLWTTLKAGDERLLFSKSDFASPAASDTFNTLVRHNNSEIRDLAGHLLSFVALDPEKVPALDGAVGKARSLNRLVLRARTPTPAALHREQRRSELPEWVSGHLAPVPAKAPPAPGSAPRTLLLASAALLLFLLAPFSATMVGRADRAVLLAGIIALDGGLLTYRFYLDPVARDRSTLRRRRRRLRWATFRSGRKIKRLQARRESIDKRFDADLAKVRSSETRCLDRNSSSRETVQRIVRESLQDLRSPIDALEEWRTQALERALKRAREGYVGSQLRIATIRHGHIPRVGLGDKAKLWLAGVRSASDVNAANAHALSALGPKKAASLLAWRTRVSERAQRIAPSVPPDHITRRIDKRYHKRKAILEGQQRAVLQRGAAVLSRLSNSSNECSIATQSALAERSVAHTTRVTAIEDEVDHYMAHYETAMEAMIEIEDQLEPYRSVTFPRFLAAVMRGTRSNSLSHP